MAQLEHADDPMLDAKVPAGQLVHADAEAAVYLPTEHEVQALAPAAAYSPPAHRSVHAVERPVVAEYFPPSQLVHADCPVPVW